MCPKETDVTPGVESSLAPGLVEGRKCYPGRSEYARQTAAAVMVWPELLASSWSRPSYHSCLHHKPHTFFPITLLLELPHLTTQNECTKEPSNQLLGNPSITSGGFVAESPRFSESTHLICWAMAWFFFPWENFRPQSVSLELSKTIRWKRFIKHTKKTLWFYVLFLVLGYVPRFSLKTFLTLELNQTKPDGSGNIFVYVMTYLRGIGPQSKDKIHL